jgi:hypothetical protein
MCRELRFERILEREDGVETGKLEVDCAIGRRISIRLYVWDDRWIWIDARQGSKADGWLWDFSDQGRLIGGLTGRNLVNAFEHSIVATSGMTKERLDRFHDIWSTIFARGPQEIVHG